ncbi:unnamed protein product [Thelazia callipaeda]|uniref:BHLH domain-containing protein n=1 Tax=Thelazia callipaeda TaxID=103827 RepID=A0A0N5D2A4_THECL|nr:unnamed protein product [Thelazia callipaeda]
MALDANEDSCMMLKREWQRSPIVVARRNARERDRVYAAFVTLKYHLPAIRSNTKRVSKLKILQAAISYIAALTDLLRTDNVKVKFVDLIIVYDYKFYYS